MSLLARRNRERSNSAAYPSPPLVWFVGSDANSNFFSTNVPSELGLLTTLKYLYAAPLRVARSLLAARSLACLALPRSQPLQPRCQRVAPRDRAKQRTGAAARVIHPPTYSRSPAWHVFCVRACVRAIATSPSTSSSTARSRPSLAR
jgi:hypothetical protein